MENLPPLFIERIKRIFEPGLLEPAVGHSFSDKNLSVRINILKTSLQEVADDFKKTGVQYRSVPWSDQALIIENRTKQQMLETECIKTGKLYIQNLSSMLPAIVLDPRPGERVLDMCAAPGSKATQIAGLMNNQGEMICLIVH